MLSKIQSTVMLIVGTAFAVFEVWGFVSPVPKETVDVLIGAIFALLAVLFPLVKLFQAFKHNITSEKVEALKRG